MASVHAFMLKETTHPSDKVDANVHDKTAKMEPLVADTAATISSKLNSSRLQNQMFAYTVTNQITNTFVEVGLPYILRGVDDVRSGKGLKMHRASSTDDTQRDHAFMEDVKHQATLPQYELFSKYAICLSAQSHFPPADYSEMVTQFGYVALYSTIWPLAPAMALINNWLELRSDAFKMTTHTRRPIPARVDTIGPWLENLVRKFST